MTEKGLNGIGIRGTSSQVRRALDLFIMADLPAPIINREGNNETIIIPCRLLKNEENVKIATEIGSHLVNVAGGGKIEEIYDDTDAPWTKAQLLDLIDALRSWNAPIRQNAEKSTETSEAKNAFLTVSDILALPEDKPVYIPTGYQDLDKALGGGLAKKTVTVLSGGTGDGKTQTMQRIKLAAIDKGYRVAEYSGEMNAQALLRSLFLAAAGPHTVMEMVIPDGGTQPVPTGAYIPDPKAVPEIKDWIGDRYRLFDSVKYGNNYDDIENSLYQLIEESKIDLLILDNLMSLDLSAGGDEKYEVQKRFVWRLHQLAIEQDIAVVLVAHPKKQLNAKMFDMYDVSGSSDIVNIVDNIVYVYRVTDRFRTAYKATHGVDYTENASNCLNVQKCRAIGASPDITIPLSYSVVTRCMTGNGITPKYKWALSSSWEDQEVDNMLLPVDDDEADKVFETQ